jgi:hypothetical protein
MSENPEGVWPGVLSLLLMLSSMSQKFTFDNCFQTFHPQATLWHNGCCHFAARNKIKHCGIAIIICTETVA